MWFWTFCAAALPVVVAGYDAMMVIGGMSISQGVDIVYSSVEAVDAAGVCDLPSLPWPSMGHAAGKVGDGVVVCGGFDGRYETTRCAKWEGGSSSWNELPTRLPAAAGRGLVFAAAATDGNENFYVAGGRSYNSSGRDWDYVDDVWRFNAASEEWKRLPNLAEPTSGGCLVHVEGGNLIFIGGSESKYRYADDPSKVWMLPSEAKLRKDEVWRWRDDLVPPLLGPRIWHGCVVAGVRGRVGIVVAGGYHAGRMAMFYPLDVDGGGNWTDMGWLPEERQWRPGFGLVAGTPTLVSGKDYGDDTMDEYDESRGMWMRNEKVRLRHKREFVAAVTVPSRWLSRCERN